MTMEQRLQLSDDEYEALWIESALKAKAEAEAEWRRRGQTSAEKRLALRRRLLALP
jgi:hypothetical protein